MSCFIRVWFLFFVAIIVAVFVYPLIHEFGHILAILIFGGNVVEFSIFPTASVLCDVSNFTSFELAITSLMGLFFPFIFTIFIFSKKFIICYILFINKFIILLSFFISSGIIILGLYEKEIANDDIIKFINLYSDLRIELLILFVVLEIYLIYNLKKDNIIDKIYEYVYINENV